MYLEPVVRYGAAGWGFDDAAPGVVWSSTDLPTNLAAVLIRRLRDGASRMSVGSDEDRERAFHPLWSPGRFRPALGDVLRFLNGDTKDEVLTDLLWALPAVSVNDRTFRFRKLQGAALVPPTDYALLKLVFLTESVMRPGAAAETLVPNEPRVATLLRAERPTEAVDVACRRLQATGLPPYLTAPVAGIAKPLAPFPSDPARTRRLLAALLFPLHRGAVQKLVELTIRELNLETV
jgi:CRISPR-associated protein Csx17